MKEVHLKFTVRWLFCSKRAETGVGGFFLGSFVYLRLSCWRLCMEMNFIAKQASKNLGNAMKQRDVEGMKTAFRNGAKLSMLDVVFDGEDQHFTDPLEIALTCALPLDAFVLLVQHGARVQTIDGGVEGTKAFFESLPDEMLDVWPDLPQIQAFLLSEEVLGMGDEHEETPEQASQIIGRALDQVSQRMQKLGGQLNSGLGGVLGKFKKS